MASEALGETVDERESDTRSLPKSDRNGRVVDYPSGPSAMVLEPATGQRIWQAFYLLTLADDGHTVD